MRETWVYWISRDSYDGELADSCNIWWIQPERRRVAGHVTWCPRLAAYTGHFGRYSLEDVMKMYRVKPDTDLELIRVEQWESK